MGDSQQQNIDHHGRRRFLLGFAVAGAGLWPSGEGAAAAERAVAILPAIASGKASADLLSAADAAIAQVGFTWLAVELCSGAELDQRLRGSGTKQATACNAEPACLAKLGRRLKVEEIVLVTARQNGEGARLTFLVVGVGDRRVRRTISVTADRLAGLEPAIFEQWHAVLGVERGALRRRISSPAASSGDELALLELAPMPSLTPPLAEVSDEASDSAGTRAPSTAAELVSVTPEMRPASPVALSPRSPLVGVEAGGSGALWYAGWGAVGAGAAVLGVSSYFGLRYRTTRDAIDEQGYLTTPLPRAVALQNQANAARGTGILLAIIGGAVAVVGSTLLVVDLAAGVEVSAVAGPGEAAASFAWVW